MFFQENALSEKTITCLRIILNGSHVYIGETHLKFSSESEGKLICLEILISSRIDYLNKFLKKFVYVSKFVEFVVFVKKRVKFLNNKINCCISNTIGVSFSWRQLGIDILKQILFPRRLHNQCSLVLRINNLS